MTLEEAMERLKEYHADSGNSDISEPIDETHGRVSDIYALQALIRWVKEEKARCEKSGAIFDDGFRCVDEGGSIFYFDPESVEKLYDLMTSLADAWINEMKHYSISTDDISEVTKMRKVRGELLAEVDHWRIK